MSQRFKVKWGWMAAAFVVGLALAFLWLRQPTQPFTRERFETARERWREAGIDSYHLRYRMNASIYGVTVRDRIVTEVTVDGRAPHGGNRRLYSMDGLFETLQLELDNLTDPGGPFGAQADSVIARVHFHPTLGYIERYLRTSGGAGSGAAIELLEFTPLN